MAVATDNVSLIWSGPPDDRVRRSIHVDTGLPVAYGRRPGGIRTYVVTLYDIGGGTRSDDRNAVPDVTGDHIACRSRPADSVPGRTTDQDAPAAAATDRRTVW